MATWSLAGLAELKAHVADDLALRTHKGPVLEALAATAGELQVRFRQYEPWPARMVLMSRRFNPNGCFDRGAGDSRCGAGVLGLGLLFALAHSGSVSRSHARGPSVPSVSARAGID